MPGGPGGLACIGANLPGAGGCIPGLVIGTKPLCVCIPGTIGLVGLGGSGGKGGPDGRGGCPGVELVPGVVLPHLKFNHELTRPRRYISLRLSKVWVKKVEKPKTWLFIEIHET